MCFESAYYYIYVKIKATMSFKMNINKNHTPQMRRKDREMPIEFANKEIDKAQNGGGSTMDGEKPIRISQ